MSRTQDLLARLQSLLHINMSDLLMDDRGPGDMAIPAARHWRGEMEEGLAQAKDAVASAIVQERQLEQRLLKVQAACDEWDRKCDTALEAGDEATARAALRRRQTYQRQAGELQSKLDHERQVVAEMKAAVADLQDKIKAMGNSKPPGPEGKRP